jgi:hypothetical protein
LARREPTWQAAEWARRQLRPQDRILSQEYRAFYFPCQMTRETIYRQRTGYDQWIQTPADLHRLLHEAGFTHLLLAEADGPGIRYNRRLTNLAAALERADRLALTTLMAYEFRDIDGATRRYRLVKVR